MICLEGYFKKTKTNNQPPDFQIQTEELEDIPSFVVLSSEINNCEWPRAVNFCNQ